MISGDLYGTQSMLTFVMQLQHRQGHRQIKPKAYDIA
jgi:hypothetical protein